jgi:hypothetical protein
MAKKKKSSLYSTFPFRLLLVTTFAALLLLGIKNIATDYQYTQILSSSSYDASGE